LSTDDDDVVVVSRLGRIKFEFCAALHGSWPELADLLGVPLGERNSWPPGEQPRRLWEYLEQRGRLAELPAHLREVQHDVLAAELEAVPPRELLAVPLRHRRPWPATLIAVAGLILGATVIVLVPAPRPAVTALVSAYRYLRPLPPPAKPHYGARCAASTDFSFTFPGTYRGEVYVQITPADPTRTGREHVSLAWGGKHWDHQGRPIDLYPGDVTRRQGGTLLIFDKETTDPGPRSAKGFLRSDDQVCAVFGTAADPIAPEPAHFFQTPSWDLD
jgi:hypothetical protein